MKNLVMKIKDVAFKASELFANTLTTTAVNQKELKSIKSEQAYNIHR